MNRYPATPAEYERLSKQLVPLREEMRRRRPPLSEDEIDRRIAGIARLVFEEVATCPACEQTVRRCDCRRLVHDQLTHLDCANESGHHREGVNR